MRVSAGFLVTGLSGKTRTYSLPRRFTERLMATRAASIWRAVIHPGSVACSPKVPKDTSSPPLARPRVRPFCCLRNLLLLGASMELDLYPDQACEPAGRCVLRDVGITSPWKIQHFTPMAPWVVRAVANPYS